MEEVELLRVVRRSRCNFSSCLKINTPQISSNALSSSATSTSFDTTSSTNVTSLLPNGLISNDDDWMPSASSMNQLNHTGSDVIQDFVPSMASLGATYASSSSSDLVSSDPIFSVPLSMGMTDVVNGFNGLNPFSQGGASSVGPGVSNSYMTSQMSGHLGYQMSGHMGSHISSNMGSHIGSHIGGHTGGPIGPGMGTQMGGQMPQAPGVTPGGTNTYMEVNTIMADGGHKYGVTALAFDTYEQLLWMGNGGGHLTSYYGAGLQKYTSFQVAPTTEGEILQLQTTESSILALTRDSIIARHRTGMPQYVYKSENFNQTQAMLQMGK
jgi:hypothetical protein